MKGKDFGGFGGSQNPSRSNLVCPCSLWGTASCRCCQLVRVMHPLDAEALVPVLERALRRRGIELPLPPLRFVRSADPRH